MEEFYPRTLAVGERVYLEQHVSWGPNSYRLATVKKLTPSGRIVLKVGDWTGHFMPDGRKVGGSYRGESIDWMPTKDRSALISEVKKVMRCARILVEIGDLKRATENADRKSVTERIAIIRAMVSKAENELNSVPKES